MLRRRRRRHTRMLLVGMPEILLAARSTSEPRRENTAGNPVGPGILGLLVRRHDPASRRYFDDGDERVEDDVGDDTRDEAVGDTVSEGHDGEGDEGGYRVTGITPIDFGGSFAHHGPNQYQGAASGPGRDGCEDWGEEYRDEEADPGEDGGEACLTAFGNAGTRFDISSDRRRAE